MEVLHCLVSSIFIGCFCCQSLLDQLPICVVVIITNNCIKVYNQVNHDDVNVLILTALISMWPDHHDLDSPTSQDSLCLNICCRGKFDKRCYLAPVGNKTTLVSRSADSRAWRNYACARRRVDLMPSGSGTSVIHPFAKLEKKMKSSGERGGIK